jgi:hypothetical protein
MLLCMQNEGALYRTTSWRNLQQSGVVKQYGNTLLGGENICDAIYAVDLVLCMHLNFHTSLCHQINIAAFT